MTPTVLDPDVSTQRWAADVPAVRALLKHVRRRGQITAEEIVAWDARHGKKLLTWDDDAAAEAWRLHEARLFLNSFRRQFDNMRVRPFIHVNADADADIGESAYFTVEAISEHSGMRRQVVADIAKRMERLASELRMWRLSSDERLEIFARLRSAIGGDD